METLKTIPKQTLYSVYACCVVFLIANTVCMLNEFYWLNLFPAVFLTPLSINLADSDVQLGLSLPVEPILAGILLLYIFRTLYERKINSKLLLHPVTIALLINLGWMGITTMTSEMPLVSLKYLIARLWFVVPFYFIGVYLFRDVSNIRRFIWMYVFPLTIVIGYTLINHAPYEFDQGSAHWVMSPFYNDHTAYGAALAMFFPALITFTFSRHYRINIRIIGGLLTLIFTVALILSYTRAAWVSLIGALLVYAVLAFRIHIQYVVTILLLGGGILALSWGDLMMKLQQNRQDSSDDFAKHIESISNISTDASNLERLNRWSSAWRMFEERPVLGWGPGTYSFVYAPFQLSTEKTIISTNAGNLGNAHSEYIGPLSESGLPGMLSVVALVICIIWTGWRVWHKLPAGPARHILVAVLMGLITYFIHGGLNNFLDTDKASVPFWAFTAMLVAADLWYKPEETI
jgi:O-antigen ligase